MLGVVERGWLIGSGCGGIGVSDAVADAGGLVVGLWDHGALGGLPLGGRTGLEDGS